MRLPDGSATGRVDFERHVVGLFGRLGCNAGACHGSFQGRGGLPEPLRPRPGPGLPRPDPRRPRAGASNLVDPDRSLVLLKATGQVAHGGGPRFAPGSWEYQVLRDWIAEGARRDPARPAVERHRGPPGRARVSDGRASRPRSRSSPGSPTAARRTSPRSATSASATTPSPTVSPLGRGPRPPAGRHRRRRLLPRPARRGPRAWCPTGRAVAVTRRARGQLHRPRGLRQAPPAQHRALRAGRPTPSSSAASPSTRSARCPRPDEVRAFLADPARTSGAEDRRAARRTRCTPRCGRQVPRHHRQRHRRDGGPAGAPSPPGQMWHDWFRKRFADEHALRPDRPRRAHRHQPRRATTPATGSTARPSPDRGAGKAGASPTTPTGRRSTCSGGGRSEEFFPVEQMAEKTAAAFLGVRLECAQCHKHPFDRWTQADYRAFANVFAEVQFGISPEGLAAAPATAGRAARGRTRNGALPPIPRLREVYVSRPVRPRGSADPDDRPPARAQGAGRAGAAATTATRARSSSRWLAAARQPVLRPQLRQPRLGATTSASAWSTRWTTSRSPTRPRTRGCSTRWRPDFVAHGYDIRRLERTILNSRTYQRSSQPERDEPRRPRRTSPAPMPRPMMAEVVVDVLNAALGVAGDFGPDAPPGGRAIEVATNRVRVARPRPRLPGLRPARRGPRPATASGRRRRRCRRRSSS